MTEEEYILTNQWMPEVIDLLDLEKNKEYAIDTIINKIRIKNVDLTSHVITFIYNNKTFNYKITIPNSINKNIVFKDSIDNINRSFCLTPENINDNSFEISLLLTKIKEKKDNNNWVSLKLSARDVELKDTGFVLQILRTARISNRIGLK